MVLRVSTRSLRLPIEVTLTRIQWSGRQVIQAFITDITERKQAEHALRDANRELRREIEQRTRAEESLNERVRMARDRKVALFIDHLPEGVWQISYEMRAESPGAFHALPVLGHAMYVPEIRTNGAEIRIRVLE